MSHSSLSVWEKSRGHLGNCRTILQEITWMIDNWENAFRPYHITRREEEIVNCENALLKVKDLIWSSCLTMFSKYDPQTKQRRGSQGALMYNQPDVATSRTVNNNTEVLVHENNRVPIAVHQREATHTVVSPSQQIMRNLLLEWSVFVNPNFQLCLVGILPNDGRWETSPISMRLGPTTVKTISGTVYTMHGKMVAPEGVTVPDFVLEKFRDGFPVDWKSVASKWISMLKEEASGTSGPRPSRAQAPELEPQIVLNDIGKKQAATQVKEYQVIVQKNAFVSPMQKQNARIETIPKENPRNQASTSRSSPLLRPSQTQEEESSEEEEEVGERNAEKKVTSVVPRYSKRLLSKSLLDTSVVTEKGVPVKKMVDEDKFRYIKNWTVELSKRINKLVLYGTLIDEKGNIMRDYHYSAAIAHRVHADIIETEKGEHYRLVGPSSSRSKDFDFGFPIHWRNLTEKLHARMPTRPLRKTIAEPSPVDRRYKNSSQSSAANNEIKRHTSMINRTVKHQLTKAQSSMVDAIRNSQQMNGAQNRTRNNSNVGKRGMDSVCVYSRKGAAVKRRKVADESQDNARTQDDSVGNISVGESDWKREVIKRLQSNERVKVEERKTVAAEQDRPKENESQKTPVKPMKSVRPVRKNLKEGSEDKYALGLVTDDCYSENEFNIF